MRAVGAKTIQAKHNELARMAEAQPVFYKSSRRRYSSNYPHTTLYFSLTLISVKCYADWPTFFLRNI